MKYLKYFEAIEDPNMIRITTDEIKECFYDIEDEGFIVKVGQPQFKLMNQNYNKSKSLELVKVPYIEVEILLDSNTINRYYKEGSYNQPSRDIKNIIMSDQYKDCIEHLNGKLSEYNLFFIQDFSNQARSDISRLDMLTPSIRIIIYRTSDREFIR